jgi:sucrose phosphorylase
LASHDGIGLTPARDLLSDSEVEKMAQRVEALGGHVSYRTAPDGSKRAYELNINYLDALGDADQPLQDVAMVARRFISAQAIMLALRGVPGIYFHSLFGSCSWPEGVKQTGRKRSINREKLRRKILEAELTDRGSLRQHVFSSYCRLLEARTADPAFHPNGEQIVLDLDSALFAIQRTAPDSHSMVFCVQNVSAETRQVRLPVRNGTLIDTLSGKMYEGTHLRVLPYQVLWLRQST